MKQLEALKKLDNFNEMESAMTNKIIHNLTSLFKRAIKMNNEINANNLGIFPDSIAKKYRSTDKRIDRLLYNENDTSQHEKNMRKRRIEQFMRSHLQIVETISNVVFDMVSIAKQNGLPTVVLKLRLATSFQAQIQVQRDPHLCTPIDRLLENLSHGRKIVELEIERQPNGFQTIGQLRLLLEGGTDALNRDQMSIEKRYEISQRWELAIDELDCIFNDFEKSEDRK